MTATKTKKTQSRVLVKQERFEQLKEAAEKEGISMSKLVEKSLSLYFKQKPSKTALN